MWIIIVCLWQRLDPQPDRDYPNCLFKWHKGPDDKKVRYVLNKTSVEHTISWLPGAQRKWMVLTLQIWCITTQLDHSFNCFQPTIWVCLHDEAQDSSIKALISLQQRLYNKMKTGYCLTAEPSVDITLACNLADICN